MVLSLGILDLGKQLSVRFQFMRPVHRLCASMSQKKQELRQKQSFIHFLRQERGPILREKYGPRAKSGLGS
jgi:DNA primase